MKFGFSPTGLKSNFIFKWLNTEMKPKLVSLTSVREKITEKIILGTIEGI